MAQKWYLNKEELKNSPSFKDGISAEKELDYKQQAAYLINDLGKRLKLSEVCVHTAIVYMRRFFIHHSLAKFHRYEVATAAIFVAAKVEEEPQKSKEVISALHICLKKTRDQQLDTTTAEFQENVKALIVNERILLATLGFKMGVNHPHHYITEFCREIKACKQLCKIFLQMANYTLQMTSMCLKYKPAVVASYCIYFTIQSSQWKIPEIIDGNLWFWLLDTKVTFDLLIKMDREFKEVLNKLSPKIQKRVMCLFKNPPVRINSMNRIVTSSSSSAQESVSTKTELKQSSSRQKISYQEYRDRLMKKKCADSDGSSTSLPQAAGEVQENSVGSTCQFAPATAKSQEITIEVLDDYIRKRESCHDMGSIYCSSKKRKLE
ncbi:cyclin-T-like [Microplitis mediator]|uniref:cyclin-T-like n=1 Tax=Microplitis mediator TaxID=375433 RepID=UPI002552752A|nr:cyclin-T-like [Microplitis mediator]